MDFGPKSRPRAGWHHAGLPARSPTRGIRLAADIGAGVAGIFVAAWLAAWRDLVLFSLTTPAGKPPEKVSVDNIEPSRWCCRRRRCGAACRWSFARARDLRCSCTRR
jgi:hypothetical protein